MRKSKKLQLTAFTILAIICLIASQAVAKPYGPGNPHRHFGGGLTGFKTFIELNLSETQETEMLGILEKYQEKRQSARERLREARDELRASLKSESISEDGVRTAYRNVSYAQEELLILGVQMRSEIKAILTPEQSELLKEKRERRFSVIRDRLENRLEKLGR